VNKTLLFCSCLVLMVLFVSCGTEEEDLTPGTISGNLTLQAGVTGNLDGTRVAIYISIADWQNDSTFRSALAVGGGASASYTISDVPPGTYYLDAWKDENGNMQFDSGDLFGVYGTSQWPNPSLTAFFLSAGEDLTIDVTLLEL
jgi:uncharacterized protein (DUF2141 family)